PYMLTLPAHGFYWFRLATNAQPPEWHLELLLSEETPVLVLFDLWNSFFRDRVVPWRIGMAEKLRARLETELLPGYIGEQRWFSRKGEPVAAAPLEDWVVWERWLFALPRVNGEQYLVPLALAWEETEDERVKRLTALTLARVRQQANVGVLADAIGDETFCRALVRAICGRAEAATAHGRLRFVPTDYCAHFAQEDVEALEVSRLHMHSSNTSVNLTSATQGDRLFLKFYRRVRHGINPESEVGRFLTEVAKFPHCVPLAGCIEYVKEGEEHPATLVLMQAYVPNQGDGWNYTL